MYQNLLILKNHFRASLELDQTEKAFRAKQHEEVKVIQRKQSDTKRMNMSLNTLFIATASYFNFEETKSTHSDDEKDEDARPRSM